MFEFFLTALVAFILAAISGIFLIPLLHRLKFGQEIREEGPKWHQKKSGTPTMGGFIFIISFVITVFAMPFAGGRGASLKEIAIITAAALCFGAIGFIDDYIKVILKRNLGLTAKQKFSLQVLVSLVFTSLIAGFGVIDMSVLIPFTGYYVNLGYLVLPLDIIVMLATVNSVNLTDGLDGLAATVTMVVSCAFMLASASLSFNTTNCLSASLAGACAGFVVWNAKPAKVFMGDTGSMFLGGMVVALSFGINRPILLLLMGCVYFIEAISVMLQVACFKLTKKRLFKMAPLHHHLEKSGYSEMKIVSLFGIETSKKVLSREVLLSLFIIV